MSKRDELTEEQILDLIVIIMDQNGGTIERDHLLNETELYEEELDDYMETLRLRGFITFTRGLHTLRDQDFEGWMVASLTDEAIQHIKDYDEDQKKFLIYNE
jgi:hypothetical protein